MSSEERWPQTIALTLDFYIPCPVEGQRNKSAAPKVEERIINEVEVERSEASEEHLVPVDFATLDQSCLAEHGTDNPAVTAPSIPNGISIKYAR